MSAATRIIITRPDDTGKGFASLLIRHGYEIWQEPVSSVHIQMAARAVLRELIALSPPMVVATSQNAVKALAQLMPERNIPLYVVGAATAECAHQLGFSRVNYGGGTARQMVGEIIRQYMPSEKPILYIAGKQVAVDVPAILRVHGFDCRRVNVYEVTPKTTLSTEFLHQLEKGEFQAITFLSQRTAEFFVGLAIQQDIEQALQGLSAFCLSQKILKTASLLSWKALHSAPKPTLASLVKTVDNTFHGTH